MTLRNWILALAGGWKLGDQFAAILKMLPPDRQAEVRANLEALRGKRPEYLAERLNRIGVRERRRVSRLGRKRVGPAWSRLDPRVIQARLMSPR